MQLWVGLLEALVPPGAGVQFTDQTSGRRHLPLPDLLNEVEGIGRNTILIQTTTMG